MELASAPLNSYSAAATVWLSAAAASRTFSPSLPIFRATGISSRRLASKSTGFMLACEKVGLRGSCLAACVGYSSAAVPELDQEDMPLGKNPNPEANDEDLKDGDEDHEGSVSESTMVRVCDRLIDLLMVDMPTPTAWRKLLTHSKQWDNIRPFFYKRCQDRADSGSDPGMTHNLLRLARKLKEVDEDIQRHNELLNVIGKSPSEVGEIVARRRKDFTREFFMHLNSVAASYHDNPAEQDDVVKLRDACLDAVEVYDFATESIEEALKTGEFKLQDVIISPAEDTASLKIDNIVEKNQLDSAQVLMNTKAWSAAKESTMGKDEAKDVLYHLYTTAVSNIQANMPKEYKMVKYLLTIEDPEERTSALKDAFTPGKEFKEGDVEWLYTTPQQLHGWIKTLVDAYHSSRRGALSVRVTYQLSPAHIPKLEELNKIIQDKFM